MGATPKPGFGARLVGDGSNPLWAVARLIAAGWVMIVVSMWAGQEVLIFPGAFGRSIDEEQRIAQLELMKLEEVHLPGADGDVVVWMRSGPYDRAVVHFHGNGQVVSDLAPMARRYQARDWLWVGMEYRGYNGVPGWPSEQALVADAGVVWDWLVDEVGIAPERIILHGESLGGGVASALADDVHPAGLVLGSTFDSLAAVAWARHPYVPVPWLLRSPFPSAARLAGLDIPALVLHAEDDPVVPVAHGRALAAVMPRAELHVVPGVAHGELVLRERAIAEVWERWLERVVPVRTSRRTGW